MKKRRIYFVISLAIALATGCSVFKPSAPAAPATQALQAVQPTTSFVEAPSAAPTCVPQPAGNCTTASPDEPVEITGRIPYTSPFFVNTVSEAFVMLEDEAGFVHRDREFHFPLSSQTIGPVQQGQGQELTFTLSLPEVPQATQLDVDNNGKQDTGVQIFQIAYWSNTWDGPFLEARDGKGWSTAYTSAITDPERDDEIVGGILLVWSPDGNQEFPTGFGADKKLFTADDPVAPIPAGYNLIDLNKEPFRFYKQQKPDLTLNEGAGAVKDYSNMNYGQAFDALYKKVSVEYPFTQLKGIDWNALYQEFKPRFDQATSDDQFYSAMKEFTLRIPDAHVNLSLDRQVFFNTYGGGFGLVLARLSDQSVIVKDVLPNQPGASAGIQRGAVIQQWNGEPVNDAIKKVVPGFAPYSSTHALELGQVDFLTRVPPGTNASVTFQNTGAAAQTVTMQAANEYDSLFMSLPSFNADPLELPVVEKTLPDSGLGYIRINTFNDDERLMASLWERYIQNAIDNKTPGLIIDMRDNSGGSMDLALNFANYFFNKEATLYDGYYYNDNSGQFEATGYPAKIQPAPQYYESPIAVLVSPNCISACEGFTYAMHYNQRSIVVGNYPTAGGFGEVGLGQYKLPGGFSIQFPTGRSQTPDGNIVIEGQGVQPDVTVPVTADSVLGQQDTVLNAAVQELLKQTK